MPKLNNATQTIRLTRGIASELTSAEHAYGQLSQLLHITDTNEVYIHNGTKFVVSKVRLLGTLTICMSARLLILGNAQH